MRILNKILFVPLTLSLCHATLAQQATIRIETDSVKILNAELILRNQTQNVSGYLYNKGDGKTVFQKLGKSIQFRVGEAGFPAAGDSVYQNAALSNYFIKVLRNGLLQYRDSTNGVKVDDASGKITFYPALQNGEPVFIEAISGIDLSVNGGGVNPGTPSPAGVQLRAGAFDNGNNTFTLKWATNAKTMYLNPKVVGVGSSTLAGYGLQAPDRLGDKISAWLTNNTASPVWENIAVAGYSSKEILPVADGGILGHNIETALNFKPDFIFISLPSNDPAVGLSVNQSIANFKKVDTLAMKRGIPVFWETTQPRTSFNATQQLMLKQLADSIRAIWPDRYVEGFKDVVDPNASTAAVIKSQYDNGDGVHLNSTGNQFIANNLFDRWLTYFRSIQSVKQYVIDSSLNGINWAQFAVVTDQNVVKKTFPRFTDEKIYFRGRAEYLDGTYSAYSNLAVLDANTEPEIPGVDDFNHRILVDLGGDGVHTLNGSNQVDGKPTPSPDNAGKYWNNWYGTGDVSGFVDGASLDQLKTAANDATNISMHLIGSPTGTFGTADTKAINYNGFTTDVGDYPNQAVYDNMFLHSSSNASGVTIRIKGLTDTNKYYIKLWGARIDPTTATGTRVLQAKSGTETWATAQSVDGKYYVGAAADYERAVRFNHVTGVDSFDINLRVNSLSTFAHVSIIDIGIMGVLPKIPELKLRDTTTTLSTMQLTAIPINGAVISSYQWSLVSGPHTVTINNATSATANISGLTNGTFIFKVVGNAANGKMLSAQATVKVYPDNGGKKTLRVHFSKTAATPLPGWVNVYSAVTNQHIEMTDAITNWTIDNVSGTEEFWKPFAGNNAANADGTVTGNNSGIIPDIALSGFWFNYSNGYDAGVDNLLIKGLNTSKTYTVKLYASRSNTAAAPRYGAWRINGGAELLQNAWTNTSAETVVTNISPDANGYIRIAVNSPSVAANGAFSYLNAIVVQEN